MRILHVAEPVVGGVARYVDTLGRHLAGRGHDQAVVCATGQPAGYGDWAEVEPVGWDRSPRSTLAVGRRIDDVIDRWGPDVVHAHSTFAGLAVARRRRPRDRDRPPVLFQPHGWARYSPEGAAGRAVAAVVEKVAAVRADATALLSQHEAAVWLAGTAKHPVGPVVDVDGFGPVDAGPRARLRHQLGLPVDRPVVVYLAEFSARKRQLDLLAALDRRPGPDGVVVVLVGDGSIGDEVRARAAACRAEVRVDGWTSRPAGYLQAADVSLLCSRGEGFALTIAESLLCGTPVVTTDVGGSELVAAGDGRGRVVAGTDELVDVLADVVADPVTDDSRRRVAAEVRASLDPVRVVDRVDELYRRLAVGAPAAVPAR